MAIQIGKRLQQQQETRPLKVPDLLRARRRVSHDGHFSTSVSDRLHAHRPISSVRSFRIRF